MLVTEPERSLDWITERLARVFEVPAALISFIDSLTFASGSMSVTSALRMP